MFFSILGNTATGNLYHVLMTHNRRKRATSLLPRDRTILGKTDLFHRGHEQTSVFVNEARRRGVLNGFTYVTVPTSIAKDDKDDYQKKGRWHKCDHWKGNECCQYLAVSTVCPHLTSLIGCATLSETTYSKANFTIG